MRRDELDIWAKSAPWVVVILVVLSFFACDTVYTPESARAIPGSVDYCADRERILISPGSYDAFVRARAEYAEYCTGRGHDIQSEVDPKSRN